MLQAHAASHCVRLLDSPATTPSTTMTQDKTLPAPEEKTSVLQLLCIALAIVALTAFTANQASELYSRIKPAMQMLKDRVANNTCYIWRHSISCLPNDNFYSEEPVAPAVHKVPSATPTSTPPNRVPALGSMG